MFDLKKIIKQKNKILTAVLAAIFALSAFLLAGINGRSGRIITASAAAEDVFQEQSWSLGDDIRTYNIKSRLNSQSFSQYNIFDYEYSENEIGFGYGGVSDNFEYGWTEVGVSDYPTNFAFKYKDSREEHGFPGTQEQTLGFHFLENPEYEISAENGLLFRNDSQILFNAHDYFLYGSIPQTNLLLEFLIFRIGINDSFVLGGSGQSTQGYNLQSSYFILNSSNLLNDWYTFDVNEIIPNANFSDYKYYLYGIEGFSQGNINPFNKNLSTIQYVGASNREGYPAEPNYGGPESDLGYSYPQNINVVTDNNGLSYISFEPYYDYERSEYSAFGSAFVFDDNLNLNLESGSFPIPFATDYFKPTTQLTVNANSNVFTITEEYGDIFEFYYTNFVTFYLKDGTSQYIRQTIWEQQSNRFISINEPTYFDDYYNQASNRILNNGVMLYDYEVNETEPTTNSHKDYIKSLLAFGVIGYYIGIIGTIIAIVANAPFALAPLLISTLLGLTIGVVASLIPGIRTAMAKVWDWLWRPSAAVIKLIVAPFKRLGRIGRSITEGIERIADRIGGGDLVPNLPIPGIPGANGNSNNIWWTLILIGLIVLTVIIINRNKRD